MDAPSPTNPNGLCDSCAHQKLVPNTRGSVFSLCLRSRTDERYPRYPRVPVEACPGYERREKILASVSISPMLARLVGRGMNMRTTRKDG